MKNAMNEKITEAIGTPYWMGSVVNDETVMIVGKNGSAELLYEPTEILSVTSYDKKTVFYAGKDFTAHGRTIALTENSEAVYIPEEVYFSQNSEIPGISVEVIRSGVPVNVYFSELIYKYQLRVTYRHAEKCAIYRPLFDEKVCANFLNKLKKGENVTMIYYGDSITHGASSSWLHGASPLVPTWPVMVTELIAEKFGYSVRYVNPGLGGTPPVPEKETEQGKPVITYVNPAVGGWRAEDGIENFDRYVGDFIDRFGCDFFLIGFGMNNPGATPDEIKGLIKTIADKAFAKAPDLSLVLLSTMVPNPEAVNGWYGNQHTFEPAFYELSAEYAAAGKESRVAPMTSVSKALLTRKKFLDYTGNNVNHPNDFMAAVYGQTIYETLIGY